MIIRTVKDRNYTVINNTVLRDKRLTWEAKGLAAYLLSQPDDWSINANHLWHEANNGLGSVKRILRELEQFGYLQRRRWRTEDGHFEWQHVLYEVPQPSDENRPMERTIERKPSDGKPFDGNPSDGFPSDGKPSHLLSTDLPSTNGLSTKEQSTSSSPPPVPPDDGWQIVRHAYESNIGAFTSMSSEMVQSAYAEHGATVIVEAIKEAVVHNKRKWAYVDSILQNWRANGRSDRIRKEGQPKVKKQYAYTDPLTGERVKVTA